MTYTLHPVFKNTKVQFVKPCFIDTRLSRRRTKFGMSGAICCAVWEDNIDKILYFVGMPYSENISTISDCGRVVPAGRGLIFYHQGMCKLYEEV